MVPGQLALARWLWLWLALALAGSGSDWLALAGWLACFLYGNFRLRVKIAGRHASFFRESPKGMPLNVGVF